MLDGNTDFTQGISVADNNNLGLGMIDSSPVAIFDEFPAECDEVLF